MTTLAEDLSLGYTVTETGCWQWTDRATKTHCVAGHPLAGDNLIVKKRRNGRTIRNCRECANAQRRRTVPVGQFMPEVAA